MTNARAKGARWERDIVKWFEDRGYAAERTLTESRDGNIGDVFVYNILYNVHLVIEAKHKAKYTREEPWKYLYGVEEAAQHHHRRTGDNYLGLLFKKTTYQGVEIWRPWAGAGAPPICDELGNEVVSTRYSLGTLMARVYSGLDTFERYFLNEYR